MKISEASEKRTTTKYGVADRFYIGLFSTVASLILGALLWLGFQVYFGGITTFISFKYVVYFSLVIGCFGALLKTNIVIETLSALMKAIVSLGRLW